MSGYTFDTDVVVDVLSAHEPARLELRRATSGGARAWISRVTWIEVMSRCEERTIRATEEFLAGFGVDELDREIADRASSLRRERKGLGLADSVVLSTAQVRGRILVTRNTRDFPAQMPGIRVPYTL